MPLHPFISRPLSEGVPARFADKPRCPECYGIHVPYDFSKPGNGTYDPVARKFEEDFNWLWLPIKCSLCPEDLVAFVEGASETCLACEGPSLTYSGEGLWLYGFDHATWCALIDGDNVANLNEDDTFEFPETEPERLRLLALVRSILRMKRHGLEDLDRCQTIFAPRSSGDCLPTNPLVKPVQSFDEDRIRSRFRNMLTRSR
jgi:hypothetical protein